MENFTPAESFPVGGHFTADEFQCKDGTDAPMGIDPLLIQGLEQIRILAGNKPVRILSGYRSPSYNAELRKKSRNVAKFSMHLTGKAADIQINGLTPSEVKALAEKVPQFDNGGIGLYPTWVHVDVRGNKSRW